MSASGASLRNSSSSSVLSLVIAFISFIFVVDEGDAVAFVLLGHAVSCATAWDTTCRGPPRHRLLLSNSHIP